MLDAMCWWCFDVGDSDQMNILKSVDYVLDGYVVQLLTKLEAL